VLSEGNRARKTIHRTMMMKKGHTPFSTSARCAGQSLNGVEVQPTGGVIQAISMLRVISTANQIRQTPV